MTSAYQWHHARQCPSTAVGESLKINLNFLIPRPPFRGDTMAEKNFGSSFAFQDTIPIKAHTNELTAKWVQFSISRFFKKKFFVFSLSAELSLEVTEILAMQKKKPRSDLRIPDQVKMFRALRLIFSWSIIHLVKGTTWTWTKGIVKVEVKVEIPAHPTKVSLWFKCFDTCCKKCFVQFSYILCTFQKRQQWQK